MGGHILIMNVEITGRGGGEAPLLFIQTPSYGLHLSEYSYNLFKCVYWMIGCSLHNLYGIELPLLILIISPVKVS